jgi:hypothetical protein
LERQLDVGDRVAGAEHRPVRFEQQLVAADPVPGRLDEQKKREQERKQAARRRRHQMVGPAELERAMKPQEHGGEQTGENHDRHRPADERPIGRQGEDEEADVEVEVGVPDPELATMEPEQVGLPARCLSDRDQDRDHRGGGEHHGAPRQAIGERSE